MRFYGSKEFYGMNVVVIIAIFIGCLFIGRAEDNVGTAALFLCGVSFCFGVKICTSYLEDMIKDNAQNSELIELDGKYYEIKYVKDKVK